MVQHCGMCFRILPQNRTLCCFRIGDRLTDKLGGSVVRDMDDTQPIVYTIYLKLFVCNTLCTRHVAGVRRKLR